MQETAPKKVKRHYANKGIIRASYAPSLLAPISVAGSLGIMKAMKKVSSGISAEDSIQLSEAAQKGLGKTGLLEKGVEIFHMDDSEKLNAKEMVNSIKENIKNLMKQEDIPNTDTILDSFIPVKYSESDKKALGALTEEFSKTMDKRMKKISKLPGIKKSMEGMEEHKEIFGKVSEALAKTQGLIFKTGNNACFLPEANKIITPAKNLATSVFHEMGHAMNYNGGGVLKVLQKARPVAMALPGIILTASIFNKRKTTDEKSDSKVQNFFDGVKKNAGKLSFLAMMPVIAEEGIASLRGDKIARGLVKSGELSKQILNKVRLTNACGFASYVFAAGIMGAGAALAVKIKDNIQEKYEAKKNAKYDIKDAKLEAKRLAKEAKKANNAAKAE